MIRMDMVTKLKSLLPIVFLLLSAFYGVPSLVPRARAATVGLVCIADPSLNPTDCPAEPANLTGAVGDTITVAVNIQGSDSLNAFDILVQVDPAVLQPVSISFADSVIQEPRYIVLQTIDADNGFAWVAMSALGYDVPSPVTGNLFDISLKVLSTNSSVITFSYGCSSNTSFPGLCLTVVEAGPLRPEMVQAASFGFAQPEFSISANSPDSPYRPVNYLSVRAGSKAEATIRLNAWAGFNDSINLSATLSIVNFGPLPPSSYPCTAETCPSVSLNSTTITPFLYGTGWATLAISAPPQQFDAPAPRTSFGVRVTGTTASLSHSILLIFTVEPPDLMISVAAISGWGEPNASATITLRSLGGFGTINLMVNPICSASTCPSSTWNLSPTNLTLSTDETAQTILTFSAPPPPDALTTAVYYYGSITAVSGNWSRSMVMAFTVFPRNFTIAVNPLTFTIVKGQTALGRVEFFSWFKTALSVSVSPSFNHGPSVTLYTCRRCGVTYLLLVSTNNTTRPGIYAVTVTAKNGWFTHTATLTLNVVANSNKLS